MAKRLGIKLMPWQQLVADVGGELDPSTGLPVYREVRVTVPRQNGKTVLILSWEVHRGLAWGRPQRIAYSAQTGKDARQKLVEDQFPLLKARKKQLAISQLRLGAGSEAVEFVNGSRIGLLASMEESGHGKTIHLGVKDEYFADFDYRRDQALIPAMATIPDAQTLMASTMGTDESIPLNEAVSQGRAMVEAGRTDGVAYFEWSANPDADLDDPAVWWSYMPALGHTITEPVVRHARETLPDSEFRRAFGNIKTSADERVIPAPVWTKVCDDHASPGAPLTFAFDVNPERSAGAIASAGEGVAELIEHRFGVGWMADRAAELDARHGPATWLVDAGGPAGALIPEFERQRLKVRPIAGRELVSACGAFFDGVIDNKIQVRSHEHLDDAVAAAAKRQVGDAWAWTRKSATADVSPLVAVTLALWGSADRPRSSNASFVALDDYLDDVEV